MPKKDLGRVGRQMKRNKERFSRLALERRLQRLAEEDMQTRSVEYKRKSKGRM